MSLAQQPHEEGREGREQRVRRATGISIRLDYFIFSLIYLVNPPPSQQHGAIIVSKVHLIF
jgi:hypothetical protein